MDDKDQNKTQEQREEEARRAEEQRNNGGKDPSRDAPADGSRQA